MRYALRVREIFRSIQGEGPVQGKVTTFIRLAGCNLRCQWCDTKYAYAGGENLMVDEVLGRVEVLGPPRRVCLTGGEPLIQPASVVLLARLLEAGYDVTLMTNGSVGMSAVPGRVRKVVDIKTPWAHLEAPGDNSNPPHFPLSNLDLLNPADEVKFVVTKREEFDWAVRFVSRTELLQRCGTVSVAPAYGQLSVEAVAEWILQSGLDLKLALQLHKYVFGPDTRR